MGGQEQKDTFLSHRATRNTVLPSPFCCRRQTASNRPRTVFEVERFNISNDVTSFQYVYRNDVNRDSDTANRDSNYANSDSRNLNVTQPR